MSRLPILGLAALALATPAAAQERDSTMVPVDSVVVTPEVPVTAAPLGPDTAPRPMTPRGAFIRSMVLPGWGQAAFGSYFRGGVFFAGWVGNWFMNFKNAVRLAEAKNIYGLRKRELADSILAVEGKDGPNALQIKQGVVPEEVIFADAAANLWRKRVRAREEQREDWIAWTLFWILASGVDGYVTAHLADFPATIDLEPAGDGAVTVRLQVPIGTFRRESP